MNGRDDDRACRTAGSGPEDPPFYDEAPPQQVGSGDGDGGQPQQAAGTTTPGQRNARHRYPGQPDGGNALDQDLDRDDDVR